MRILLFLLFLVLPGASVLAQNLPANGNFDPALISLTKTCSQPVDGQHQGVAGKIWNCQILVDINPASGVGSSQPLPPFIDQDNDGMPVPLDCDDLDAGMSPALIEVPNDGVDNNCNGYTDADEPTLDSDGDGFPAAMECNDGDPAIHYGATETDNDGVDSNCDGYDNANPATASGSTASIPFTGILSITDTVQPIVGTGAQIISVTSASGNLNCSGGHVCHAIGQLFDASGVEQVNVQLFLSQTGQNVSFGATNCPSGSYFTGLNQAPVNFSGNCVSTNWTASPSGTLTPSTTNGHSTSNQTGTDTNNNLSNTGLSGGVGTSGSQDADNPGTTTPSPAPTTNQAGTGQSTPLPTKSGYFIPTHIEIVKSCSPPVSGQFNGANGKFWDCQIRVDTTNAVSGITIPGDVHITDAFQTSAGTSAQVVSMSSTSGNFNCSSNPTCSIIGSQFDASGVETINVRLFLSASGTQPTNSTENCASGQYTFDNITANILGNCVSTQWDSPVNSGGNTGGGSGNNNGGATANLDIAKSCDPLISLGNGSYSLTCQLTVTGSNLPAGETIVLADLFGGQTGSNMGLLPFLTNFSSSEPWSCGALNPNVQGCTLDPADLAAAGGSSTLSTTTVFQNPDNYAQAFNCLQVDTHNGYPPPGGKSTRPQLPSGIQGFSQGRTKSAQSQFGDVCVIVDIPKDDDKPDIVAKLEKKCRQLPRLGAYINVICEFDVALSGPASGPVTVTDMFSQLSGSPVVFGSQIGSSDAGWICNNPLYTPQNPMACTISAADLASLGNISSVWAQFSFPASGYNAAQFENCGSINMGDTPLGNSNCVPLGNGKPDTGGTGTGPVVVDGGSLSAGNLPDPEVLQDDTFSGGATPSGPDIAVGGVSIPNPTDPTGPISTPMPNNGTTPVAELVVGKRAVGPCKVNRGQQSYECRFRLSVRNAGNARYNGPASLRDQFGKPRPTKLRMATRNGWSCSGVSGGSTSCTHPRLRLAPGAMSQFDIIVTLPGLRKGGSFRNCAMLGIPKSRSQRVAMIQQIMNDRGLKAGTVDGRAGRNTFAALARLKAQLGLPNTKQFDEALFAALGLSGGSKPACASSKLPAMPRPLLKCDRTSTLQKGEKCVCRYRGMTKVSATRCACKAGRNLVPGKGCLLPVVKPKPVPILQCHKPTTVFKKGRCLCRYPNMVRKDAANCRCKPGSRLIAGKGCVKKIVRPKPVPSASKCDPRTTRARGKSCVCIDRKAVKISATRCGCRKNAQMVLGRCVPFRTRPAPTKPRPDKPVPSKPGKLVPGVKIVPGKALIQLKN